MNSAPTSPEFDPPLISVVIPVGPGERSWRTLLNDLDAARAALDIGAADLERIVSACAPRPGALAEADTIWIEGPAGRAAQLNRGIAAARGDAVWMLHADSRVDQTAMKAAWDFASTSHRALGWFRLTFADDGPLAARLNAFGANLRSRVLGLPFGDQGLLIERILLHELAGFDEVFGLGEDLEFVVRARRNGIPSQSVGAGLTTSARRYRDHGWARTTLSHLGLTLQLWRKARRQVSNDEKQSTDEHG